MNLSIFYRGSGARPDPKIFENLGPDHPPEPDLAQAAELAFSQFAQAAVAACASCETRAPRPSTCSLSNRSTS